MSDKQGFQINVSQTFTYGAHVRWKHVRRVYRFDPRWNIGGNLYRCTVRIVETITATGLWQWHIFRVNEYIEKPNEIVHKKKWPTNCRLKLLSGHSFFLYNSRRKETLLMRRTDILVGIRFRHVACKSCTLGEAFLAYRRITRQLARHLTVQRVIVVHATVNSSLYVADE